MHKAIDTSSGLRINTVQRPAHCKFSQHHNLLDRQRRVALRATELVCKIARHYIGRGQGFTGVGEQRLGVDVWLHEKHRAGLVGF